MPDSTLDCSADPTSVGYSCPGVALPTDFDPTLVCSGGTAMVDGTVGYCCAAGSAVFGCMVDTTLACPVGAMGESCVGGATPDTSAEACSIPAPEGGGVEGYCCIRFTSTASTCALDEAVIGCQFPSYGFSCAAGDNPGTLAPSLNCSTPTAVGGMDLFCCQ
jgi:hypothetical protein